MKENHQNNITRWFEDQSSENVAVVDCKNASMGEMIRALKREDLRVPNGFSTTSKAYRDFIQANDLKQKIHDRLDDLHQGKHPLEKIGKSMRRLFARATFPENTAQHLEADWLDHRAAQQHPPVEEPPNQPKKSPIKEPPPKEPDREPPRKPPPPSVPPVEEPPSEPDQPPIKEPPPKDLQNSDV